MDIASRSHRKDVMDKDISSFFFSNFPDRYQASDMFDVFVTMEEFGKLLFRKERRAIEKGLASCVFFIWMIQQASNRIGQHLCGGGEIAF